MNASDAPAAELAAQYQALVGHAAVVELGRRTQIEFRGGDRASFLHNLSTNEIRKLAAGSGCEAFFTSVQGKTLGHGFVFGSADSLIVETVGGQAEPLLAHFDHYLVCEQVELVDRSGQWSELFVGGPEAETLVGQLAHARLPQARLSHAMVSLADRTVSLRRADLAGPVGLLVSGKHDDVAAVRAALVAAGITPCGESAFEAARIEWGFPLYGRDITEANLPQEVARDALAISFTKGCYLGQETVARIDALGHVNKTLVGLRFVSPTVPADGSELTAVGQVVGHLTSAAFSPRAGAAVALAYVRRGHNEPGRRRGFSGGRSRGRGVAGVSLS